MKVRCILEAHLIQGKKFDFSVVKAANESFKNAGSLMSLMPAKKRALLKAAQRTHCFMRTI
jgi:hypothetical protein